MSINSIHGNSFANIHQQRPVKDVPQVPVMKPQNLPAAVVNSASNLHGSVSNVGQSDIADPQAMQGHLASLRMHKAVSDFHESVGNTKTEVSARLDSVRENVSGLTERARDIGTPEAKDRLSAIMDNTMSKLSALKDGVTGKIAHQTGGLSDRIDDMRAELNVKYSAAAERVTGRAEAAIEKATEAGNSDRVTHIQDRLAETLARLDEKSSSVNARLDMLQSRLPGDGVVADAEVELEVEVEVESVALDDGAAADSVADADQADEEVIA